MPAQQLKKLSVATVYGRIEPRAVLEAGPGGLPIMDVFGLAVGVKTGNKDFGGEMREWAGLTGTFECVNVATGEAMRASTLFIPEIALTPIRVALDSTGKGVSVAMRLLAVEAKNPKPGGAFYEYRVESLLAQAENDPIAMIKAQVEKERAALPAPSKSRAESGGDAPKPATKSKRR